MNVLRESLRVAVSDQARIMRGFVVEIENHLPRRFRFDGLFGRGPHFRFDASAAHGSGDRAVFANKQPRALVARDRTIGVNNGGKGAALAGTPHAHDFFEEVHWLPVKDWRTAVDGPWQ